MELGGVHSVLMEISSVRHIKSHESVSKTTLGKGSRLVPAPVEQTHDCFVKRSWPPSPQRTCVLHQRPRKASFLDTPPNQHSKAIDAVVAAKTPRPCQCRRGWARFGVIMGKQERDTLGRIRRRLDDRAGSCQPAGDPRDATRTALRHPHWIDGTRRQALKTPEELRIVSCKSEDPLVFITHEHCLDRAGCSKRQQSACQEVAGVLKLIDKDQGETLADEPAYGLAPISVQNRRRDEVAVAMSHTTPHLPFLSLRGAHRGLAVILDPDESLSKALLGCENRSILAPPAWPYAEERATVPRLPPSPNERGG